MKANAYGNGDYEVARTCIEAGADMLAVSSLDEAMINGEAKEVYK